MNEDLDALLCHAAFTLPVTATGVFMWMPAGLQTVTPFAGSNGVPVHVLVDKSGAVEIEKQRQALAAKGAAPYFDFEHEDDGASYWPTEFFWSESPEPGIYCRGEWTADGKSGVEGKKWRYFSPVFHVDNKRGTPARLIARDFAKPNMGGLVNDPAFKKISPLWAKNAGGAHPSPNNTDNDDMKPEELAALRAKCGELENELTSLRGQQAALKAKNENDALVLAQIGAAEARLGLTRSQVEIEELKAKNTDQAAVIRKANEATAKAAVKDAIDRGAIAAKDTETIAAWEADITENPDRAALLAKMGGNPALAGGRITPPVQGGGGGNSRIIVTGVAAKDSVNAYGALLAKNVGIPMSAATAEEKAKLAAEAGAIFAADLHDVDLFGAIMAADSTSDNLGVLTGALAMQQTLPALVRKNPVLSMVANDFSAEPGLYQRTDNTRLVLRPAVQIYDATLNTDGRPKGWITVSEARTLDVPVTLSTYFAVPIVFGVTTIASTGRQLFDETAPQAINAMGGYLTDQLTALMTAANFNGYAGVSLTGGSTTSGSKTVAVTSTANAFPGAEISGTNIPAGTFIKEVTNATTLQLSKAATGTTGSLTFTLSSQGVVATAMATYVKALASFAVADMDSLAALFDDNNVPMEDRFACLSPAYYRKLGSDNQINALLQGTGNAEYLTKRKLPMISNFELDNAPYVPRTSNRVGFAGHKCALVVKTRLPMDLQTVLPGTPLPGAVATITDPVSNLSMALSSYYNLQAGFAEWRPELMSGVAVGDRRAGLVITSA